jgi:hypothetical protein
VTINLNESLIQETASQLNVMNSTRFVASKQTNN